MSLKITEHMKQMNVCKAEVGVILSVQNAGGKKSPRDTIFQGLFGDRFGQLVKICV